MHIVAATVAFGVGVHCFGAWEVIHLGLADDTESYVQETGRAGWDSSPALALLLLKPGANTYAEESTQLTHLNVEEMSVFVTLMDTFIRTWENVCVVMFVLNLVYLVNVRAIMAHLYSKVKLNIRKKVNSWIS